MGRSQVLRPVPRPRKRTCAGSTTPEPEARQIIEVAKGLEGIVRNSSIHAAAVVIADRPLTDIVPLQLAEDKSASAADGERSYRTVTQYPMKPIEEIGLLKMDFLGLRNLDVIEAALDIIEQSTGERPDMTALPLDDPKTYEMLAARRLGRRVPVRVRRHARRAQEGAPDGVQRPRRAGRPLPAGRDALHRHLRAQQAQPGRDQLLRRAPAPDHRVVARGDPLPGAVDADRQGDRRLLRPRGGRPAQGDRQEAARPHGGAQGPLLRGRPRQRHLGAGDRRAVGRQRGGRRLLVQPLPRRLLRADLVPHRLAQGQLPGRVHGRADLLGDVDQGQGAVLRRPVRGHGHRGAAARRQPVGARLQGRRGQHPLRARRREGARLPRRRGDHPRSRGGRPVHLDLGLLPARRLPGGEQEGERVARQVRRVRLPAGHAHRPGAHAAAGPGRGHPSPAGRASGQSSFFDLDGADDEAAAHHDPPIPELPDDRKQLNEWEKETLGLFLSSHPLKEVRHALRAKVRLLAGRPGAARRTASG